MPAENATLSVISKDFLVRDKASRCQTRLPNNMCKTVAAAPGAASVRHVHLIDAGTGKHDALVEACLPYNSLWRDYVRS